MYTFIHHNTNRRSGFTLIELLVVIAVIGILSTIGLVAFNSAREKARDAVRKSDIKQLSIGLALYYDANDSTYPDSFSGHAAGHTDDNSEAPTPNPTWNSITLTQKTVRADSAGSCAGPTGCAGNNGGDLLYDALALNSKYVSRLPNPIASGANDLMKQYWYISCVGKGDSAQTSANAYVLLIEFERPADSAKSWWVYSSTRSDAKEVAPVAAPCT